jgi:hypothetical protein
MDCHLPNTHFTLLGFFKEIKYDEWMEQLFKHEGDCLWTDEEFQFMQDNREVWPQECTWTGLNSSDYNSPGIYYDIKPSQYGRMDIGLYTDGICIQDYTGDEFTVEGVMRMVVSAAYGEDQQDNQQDDRDQNKGNLTELVDYISQWNDAFDVYKVFDPTS